MVTGRKVRHVVPLPRRHRRGSQAGWYILAVVGLIPCVAVIGYGAAYLAVLLIRLAS